MSVRCACREKTGTDPARSTPAALESPALAQAVRGGDTGRRKHPVGLSAGERPLITLNVHL